MRIVTIICVMGLTAGCQQVPPPSPAPGYRDDIAAVAHELLKPKVHYRDLRNRGPLFLDDRLMRCVPRDPSQDVGIDPDPPVSEVTCTIKPLLHDVAALAPPPTYIDIRPPNPMKVPFREGPASPPPSEISLDLTTGPALIEGGDGQVWMTIGIIVTRPFFDKLNWAPRDGNHRKGFPELLARYRQGIVVRSIHVWRS
jgi:hypothetical protein